MPFTAHPFDVFVWYTYCMEVITGGVDFSVILGSLRPLWLFTLIPVSHIYRFLSLRTGFHAIPIDQLPPLFDPKYGVAFVTDPLFNLLVKTPMLITDIATTFILYKIVDQSLGKKASIKASYLFYLNPFSIWISAAWGQYESIPVFFTMCSFYFLLNKKIPYSALSLLIATLFKVYPAILILPISLYMLKRSEHIYLLKYYLIFFIPLFLFLLSGGAHNSTFPIGFFSQKTFFGLFGFGLTYWSISLIYPLNPQFWAPISSLIMISLSLMSLFYLSKIRFNDLMKDISIGLFLIVWTFFLSGRYVAEQRFLWILPFLIFMVLKDVFSEKLYISLSLFAFLYTQKNFPYYLLPLVRNNQVLLEKIFQYMIPFGNITDHILVPSLLGAIILSIIGITFSVLFSMLYLKVVRRTEL